MQLHRLPILSFYLLLPLYEGCNEVQYVTSSKEIKKNSHPRLWLPHTLHKVNNAEESADGAVLIMDFLVSL